MMNITLNKQFIFKTVGYESAQQLMTFRSAHNFFGSFIMPWVSSIIFITNMLVSVLSAIIYTKTKKQNHKPAFVFIGILSFFDMLVGGSMLFFTLTVETAGFKWENKIVDCKFVTLYAFFINGGSLYTLLALTVDRYIFIMKPLHYPLIMTPRRTWLLLLLALSTAMITTIFASFAFELPIEDPNGQICAGTHVFKSWIQIYMYLTFSIFLMIVIVIYMRMFAKFRQSRKKLEAIKKLTEEDYTRSKVTFHQNRGICKKHFISEVPGVSNKPIQTLHVKSLESDYKNFLKKSIRRKKRRSSSVLKSMTTLASHVRAARYILVIVIALLFTWTPWFSYVLYENILHLAQGDLEESNGALNMTTILECLNRVWQEKECNVTMPIEIEYEIKETVKTIVHLDEANIMSVMLSMFLSSVNSMANPVLYAFWYPDFRKHLVLLIPCWSKRK